MEGTASWSQLNFVVLMVLMVFGFAFALAWRIQEYRSKDRHTERTVYQQEISSLHDKVNLIEDSLQKRLEAIKDGFENRLRSIEVSNAGTLVILEHVEEFRKEFVKRFEQLQRERQTDMKRINDQLAGIHNKTRGMDMGEDSDVR
jgi:DNA anti-recombination protein RmuC